jgi:hypothetical protein
MGANACGVAIREPKQANRNMLRIAEIGKNLCTDGNILPLIAIFFPIFCSNFVRIRGFLCRCCRQPISEHHFLATFSLFWRSNQ